MSDEREFLESLAAFAHEQWSGWMAYLFEQSTRNDDGTVTIPAWAVDRWTRQMRTPYQELPQEEKRSDRVEAAKMWERMKRYRFAQHSRINDQHEGNS